MATQKLETDYLVVGCGASGMAFADALIADSDADVIMVDRRCAAQPPGVRHAMKRYLENVGPGLARLKQFVKEARAEVG